MSAVTRPPRDADYCLERGIARGRCANRRLAVGVSPRMLVHHFGSRQDSSRAPCARSARVSARSSRRVCAAAGTALRRRSCRRVAVVRRRRGAAVPAPVRAVAGARRAPATVRGILERIRARLAPAIEAGFAADGADPDTARELSMLTVAVVRGLLQDANATGDWERASAAFARFVSLLSRGPLD